MTGMNEAHLAGTRCRVRQGEGQLVMEDQLPKGRGRQEVSVWFHPRELSKISWVLIESQHC